MALNCPTWFLDIQLPVSLTFIYLNHHISAAMSVKQCLPMSVNVKVTVVSQKWINKKLFYIIALKHVPMIQNIQDMQCSYNITLRRICVTIVAVEKGWVLNIMSLCLNSCIFSALYYAWLMGGGNVLNVMCVLIFSTILTETFLILRRIQWDIVVTVHGLYVKYPLFLSDFNETWIFSTVYKKIHKYKISWKSAQWEPSSSMRTDKRTDMKKLVVVFRNFLHMHTNKTVCLINKIMAGLYAVTFDPYIVNQ
jgi:hypothetical protein